jgi:2-iminobutanoate/2-iminopropanoate deaminase
VDKTLFGSVDSSGRPALLSRAARVNGFIYTAGITARGPDGTVPTGMTEQTENVLTRLQEILSEAGASMSDVIKVNVYVTTMEYKAAMNEAYKRFFPKEAPARAMVQVAGLASPEYLIEIEVVAAAP